MKRPRPDRFLLAARGTVAAAVAFCLFLGCAKSNKTAIAIAGSTSVEPFAERLAETYVARLNRMNKSRPAGQRPDIEINVQGGGSSAGVRAVQNGICQIGMSSRNLTAEEKGLYEIPIAIDGIVIIVNRDNPLTSITLEQARAVFAGRIRSWHDLGSAGRRITAITREDGSGTRASFEEKVMVLEDGAVESFAPDALVQDSNGAVREIVAGDLAAIGYISHGLVDERVRALAIDSIVPSDSTIRNGTYPLTRRFLFLTRQEARGAVKQFIDYVLSPEGQQVLAEEGLTRIGP